MLRRCDEQGVTLILLSGANPAGQLPMGSLIQRRGDELSAAVMRRVAGRDDVIRRADVVLAAPDIDVEVFSQQLRVVGPLTPPMKILVAKDDRALRVSGLLASSLGRVGAVDIEDSRVQEAVVRARVQVIDISELQSADGLGHDRFVYLAGLYPQLARRPALSHAGVFLLDAAGAIVTAPLHTELLNAAAD